MHYLHGWQREKEEVDKTAENSLRDAEFYTRISAVFNEPPAGKRDVSVDAGKDQNKIRCSKNK